MTTPFIVFKKYSFLFYCNQIKSNLTETDPLLVVTDVGYLFEPVV